MHPAANTRVLSGLRNALSVNCLRFLVSRKTYRRLAKEPLSHHDKGIVASPLSLSRIVIPPFPHSFRARMRVGKRLLRRPMSRVSCVGNHFTGFRFSLSRFSVVKIFYRRLMHIYAFIRFPSHVMRCSPSVLRRGGDEEGYSVAM